MQIFQAAFMVIVLTAVTTQGRTASKTKFSLQELALLKQITEIGDKFSEYWLKNSQCIHEIISNSDVNDSWDDIKRKIDNLVKVQWKKSADIKDIAERQKSKVVVVENGVDVIKGLVSKLINESKLDLLNNITASTCWKHHDFFDELQHFETFTVPTKFQCLVDVVGNVSETNRLKHLWTQVEPNLQQHLDMRKSCSRDDTSLKVNHLCNLKEGIITYKLLTEYLHLAAAEKPSIINKLACEVEQGCSGYQFLFFVEAHEIENADRIIEILKCHSDAISEVVRLSYYEKTWTKYQKQLNSVYKQIKVCEIMADNSWEATKCIAKEAQHASERIGRFMGKFDEDASAFLYDFYRMYKFQSFGYTHKAVQEMIKKKCHSKKPGFFYSLYEKLRL